MILFGKNGNNHDISDIKPLVMKKDEQLFDLDWWQFSR